MLSANQNKFTIVKAITQYMQIEYKVIQDHTAIVQITTKQSIQMHFNKITISNS